MLKLLTFPGHDEEGNVFVQAIKPEDGLVKEASANLHSEIKDYIAGIKPDSENVYVLVNALGAGEYYGSNINGDYFEEAELNPKTDTDLSGYRTFGRAGIYRHHKNKDIQKSMGEVVCSTYNPVMHRVELILKVNRAKAAELGHEDLVRKLDAGEHPAVSMGCKVKYDVCSICGHKSKTRKDYCVHTRTMMGKVYPDGRKVFVYNPKPRFFDISFVVIGADRTSYAMAKVASVYGGSSALAAEESGLRDGVALDTLREKLANKRKTSELLKRVPALSAKHIKPVADAEPDLKKSTLDSLAKHPLSKSLTTAAAGGIVLKPREYQRVILIRIGRPGLADRLDSAGQVFAPSSSVDRSVSIGAPSDHSSAIRNLLLGSIRDRSMFEPVIKKRIIIIKSTGSSTDPSTQRMLVMRKTSAAEVNLTNEETALLNKIAAGYNGYREQLLEKISSIVDDITRGDIKLLSAIDNGTGLEEAFMGHGLTKEAKLPSALLGVFPLMYLYGANVKKKRGSGQDIGALDRFVEQHPVLATSVLVGLTRLGMGLATKGKGGSNLLEKTIARID